MIGEDQQTGRVRQLLLSGRKTAGAWLGLGSDGRRPRFSLGPGLTGFWSTWNMDWETTHRWCHSFARSPVSDRLPWCEHLGMISFGSSASWMPGRRVLSFPM